SAAATPETSAVQAGSAPAAAAPAASGAPAAASAPGAAASAPAAGTPPAFANVIKGAKKIDGLFTLWQKDDKVWIELKPEDLGKPLLLSPKLATGIGENGIFGGSMSLRFAAMEEQLVEFRRIHNQVQLIARNTEFFAKAGSPEGRAVAAAFSPSLLGSTAVASQPHPTAKSILIEANALFVGDMLGLGQALQRSYRQSYAFDARNSAILRVRGKADSVVFETQNHYATASIALPQPNTPPGTPVPTAPRTLPDARSLFLQLHYSLARLPETTMHPRAADPRVGYFVTRVQDFSDDLARTPSVRYVNRWRLDKKDPSAELSEPVKPIIYWLDRTIPEKYRGAITAGVLEWNKAFEKIGFKNAIVVKVQPEDADFDTLDVDVASIRWMTNASPQFGAIGPSHVDPRSGEILDADIAIESLSSRNLRAARSQILDARTAAAELPALMQLPDVAAPAAAGDAAAMHNPLQCDQAEMAAEQLGYMLDVLEARGELEPDSLEAQQFVLDYLKDVTMHEVGHTLGLRHNFRASRLYTEAQLSDPEFTRTHALTGSVMEYAPINLARAGERGGTPFQTTLGPYDYWAIEYAYKPIPADQEAAELKRIASHSAERQFAYGTDEDNFLGIDPEALQFDLGADPLAFARKRLDIARELLSRQEGRELKHGEDYSVLRRSVSYALRDVARATGVAARQIGGVLTLRDFPGSGRDPLEPLPAATQRETLELLARGLLAADSFKISPALQRRLAPDFQERTDAIFGGEPMVATDFSPAQQVLEVQRALLAQLMSDGVAVRILDSEAKAARGTDAFRLSELYSRLDREVWSELAGGGDIPSLRRELQRDYVNRLSGLLLRPAALSRADARSLLRAQAQSLLARINAAGRRGGLSAEARAHLQDSAETLQQALAAKLQRTGA
ncbi:MAG TPA: zinc-dependent metalloprotease, partial [Methylibium sp.]